MAKDNHKPTSLDDLAAMINGGFSNMEKQNDSKALRRQLEGFGFFFPEAVDALPVGALGDLLRYPPGVHRAPPS